MYLFTVENGHVMSGKSATLGGRIWDIGFLPAMGEDDKKEPIDQGCALAVASGDYKTVFFNTENLQPTLQVLRSRTVRCLAYHPHDPVIAIGDGAGSVAIVDFKEEETISEFDVGGRVNTLEFSPSGDYLLVGTDSCVFTLHDTMVCS